MFYVNSYVSVVIAIGVARAMHGKRQELSRWRRLGSYELIQCIGEGGMGQVWQARHRLLARPAAVKLIRPEAAKRLDKSSPNTMPERFDKEAKVTARLRSPHTVELYDYGLSDEGVLYFAMEYLDGVDLFRMVKLFGPLPPERVVHLLIQACWSLSEAHALGLIHRDIKPANLFLSRAGTMVDHLKVLDFGLTWLDPSQSSPELSDLPAELSMVGKVQGTPAFMAPEVALGREIDGRADLYCLGLVAFWLLTGELAFPGKGSAAIMMAQAYEEARPVSLVSSFDIPPELDAVIASLLAKEPDARPSSASELKMLLESLELHQKWTQEQANAWWNQLDETRSQSSAGVSGDALTTRSTK
jgi:serine/threonine-protein kinase